MNRNLVAGVVLCSLVVAGCAASVPRSVGGEACLARMEQAMKDIEPFIPPPYWAGFDLPEHGGVRVTLLRESVQAFREAMAHWEQTKQECWKEQP